MVTNNISFPPTFCGKIMWEMMTFIIRSIRENATREDVVWFLGTAASKAEALHVHRNA